MNYLENLLIGRNEFGLLLELTLGRDWKKAAKRFPTERAQQILFPRINFARKLCPDTDIRTSEEYGLMGVSFTSDRAGVDLFPDQHMYIGHNLAQPEQIVASLAIIIDYLKLLECIKL